MSGEIILSAQNPIIKRIRSLGSRKHRETERVVVLEGVRLVATALDAGMRPDVVLLSGGAGAEATAVAARAGDVARVVDDRVLAGVSDTVHTQGLLAIAPEPRWELPSGAAPLVLALDHIADPGNLGTMVRTAAAAGVDAIVVSPGSVDPWSAKALRAGMGAHFLVPILDGGDPDVIGWLRRVCPKRWVADASGPIDHAAADWSDGVAIIVGSEAHGVTAWGNDLANGSVRIQMVRKVDSLNAAVAAAVLMFAASSHRHRGDRGF